MLVRIHNTNMRPGGRVVAQSPQSNCAGVVEAARSLARGVRTGEESPRSLRRVSSITTINSSTLWRRVGSRCRRLGLGSFGPPGIDVAHLRPISACSIQVHSLNSFSISMKRRRETVERWWDVEDS